MSRIIGADSHFMEPLDLWERYIEPKYRSRCLRFEREPDGNYAMLLDGKRSLGMGEFTNRELLGVAVGFGQKEEGLNLTSSIRRRYSPTRSRTWTGGSGSSTTRESSRSSS